MASNVDAMSPRLRAFVDHLVQGFAPREAAVAAGYAPTTARNASSEMARRADVVQAVRAGRRAVAESLSTTVPEIVAEWVRIVEADPNEIARLAVGACRYCHGDGHAYQWRTAREFDLALADWRALADRLRERAPMPEDGGGYGYSHNHAPNPACPECDGRGSAAIVFGDTTRLSASARALFAGVKERHGGGIEIIMRDKDHALDRLAAYLGIADGDGGKADGLGELIAEIQSRMTSRPPLASDPQVPAPSRPQGSGA